MHCDCGTSLVRKSADILKAKKAGKNSSCGCAHHLKTHGLSVSHRNLHMVWKAMRARCENPASKDFPNYGQRGIAVCRQWSDFAEFARWAEASGYRKGLTIERKNVRAGYEPANCTWVPNRMQARNRRHTHTFTHEGVTLDIRGWSEASGVPYYTLRSRLLVHGWPIARAISEPIRGAA